jgi:hypothetical protein
MRRTTEIGPTLRSTVDRSATIANDTTKLLWQLAGAVSRAANASDEDSPEHNPAERERALEESRLYQRLLMRRMVHTTKLGWRVELAADGAPIKIIEPLIRAL